MKIIRRSIKHNTNITKCCYVHTTCCIISYFLHSLNLNITRYEEQLNKIDGTLCTIEFQREALENANTNTEVLKNMGFAAKALEGAHKQIGDIDKVCFAIF